MQDIVHNINLNLSQPNNFEYIHIMQGDYNTEKVIVTLFNGNKLYTVDAQKACLQGSTSNGGLIIQDDLKISTDKHQVTFDITKEMSSCSGELTCNIVFSSDNQKKSTFPFVIKNTADITGQTPVSVLTTISDYVDRAEKAALDAEKTLKDKADKDHKHTKSDITDFPTLGTASSKDVATRGNASASQVVMGNDTRLSDTRKASDVHDWAKASTKPTYTASEVGAYTKTETDTKLNGKANSSHTHTKSQITDFPTSMPANGGDSSTVNGHTVNSDVPANAKFIDYSKDDINTLLTIEPDINGGTVVGGSVLNGEVTNLDTLRTSLRNSRSFVGSVQGLNNWQNLISVRHRNGVDDGTNYGMYIRADMTDVTDPKGASLVWDRDYQSGGVNKWQGERTILDSGNYELYAATKDHNHSKILDSGDNSELTFGYSKAGVTTSDFTSLACWCGTELRCVDKAQFATANHNHSKILDSNDSRELTFAYSKTGMNSSDYNWLAAWNGNELRAVNKSHFAASNHNHDGRYAKILQGGNTAGGGSVSISLPTREYWIIQIQGTCRYNSSSPTTGTVRGFIYGYGKDLYQVIDAKFISVSVSGNTITISQSGWISSSDGAFGACLLQLG